ncbi:MAG: hypothetical protein ACOYOJ_22875 [Alsobacter sp.]
MTDARFCRIVLHLARSKANPEGSSRYGYDLVAPLDASGHLDVAAWKDARARCRVRRFWAGEPDQIGHLVHRPGGRGGATWAFDYDPAAHDDDEAGYRLGDHVISPGEYVSLADEDGELHTFKVESVGPA